MNEQVDWGYALFGKRDGFEIRATRGVLTEFQRPEAFDVLSQAIQLRLEEFRLFAQEEMLGFSCCWWNQHLYRFFSLYRYALDQYKRDGYTAVSLALKNGTANSSDVLQLLELLLAQGEEPLEPVAGAYMGSWLEVVPDRGKLAGPGSKQLAYIPLSGDSWEEKVALIAGWMEQDPASCPQIFASSSRQTFHSIDPAQVRLFTYNPFWEMEAPDLPGEAWEYEGHTPEKVRAEPTEPPPPDSLVYAYEQAGKNLWEPKKQRKGRLFNRIKELLLGSTS